MCGFAALFEPGRRFDRDLLDAMDGDLFHRGPDSGGRLDEPGVAVVFRRLAILDPRARADQPMTTSDGAVSLAFNGEIYNFAAIRAALEAQGERFASSGDTEVVLRAYLRWGEEFLERLEGMFALVVVDRREGVAIAARDPFGIKPLYLAVRDRLVAFASEMRPLRRLVGTAVDESALAELLTFGWAAGARSNLRGIERLPGGTAVRVDLGSGRTSRRTYFDVLDTLSPGADEVDGETAAVAVLDELSRSAGAHLASDVGYALQLSGGVDSSLVAALVRTEDRGELHTFGISLGNHAYDEGEHRAAVVERLRLAHHEEPLDGRRFADALPRAVAHMEGPVPHGGCVMLMLLCDRIRETHKVVLTGEGADEFFGGYQRYAIWRKLAAQERLGRLLPSSMWPPMRPFLGVRKLAGRDAAAFASVYRDFRAMERLFPALVSTGGARLDASARFRDFRDRLYAVDQTSYLESLLVRQDRMSMAASVEARVPFVHAPLVRLVNRLSHSIRTPGGDTKPLLKRIAERLLPASVVRRRKVGLLLPYDDWLDDASSLGRHLDDVAAPDARLASYAAPGALARIVERFRAGERDGLPSMFYLVNVETWLRSLEGANA